jgi:hypothetical protein
MLGGLWVGILGLVKTRGVGPSGRLLGVCPQRDGGSSRGIPVTP